MQDPLVGLSFDPRQVRFDDAPTIALTADDKKRGKWYLFAQYEDKANTGWTYMIVSGLVSVYGDTRPKAVVATEPDFGFLTRCDAERCEVLGVPDRMFGDLGLPDSVVSGLAADAVSKMIVAFRGRDGLQESLDDFSSRAKNPSMESRLLKAFEAAGLDMTRWKSM
jgi:hypothetical protein